MPDSLTFHGAAQTVTGSKHLLCTAGKNVLVDCGMFQGPRELRERNWQPFGFDLNDLDAVVLTHAHMDHIGMVPRLVKQGYRGPIYATPATIGLARVSLPDSGRLQEEDAQFHNRHGTSRHVPADPLYNEAEAFESLKQFRPVHYFEHKDLGGGLGFRYVPAGHILGSAFAEFVLDSGHTLLMGGDLGRWDRPIIKDPTEMKLADTLVLESTYGDRLHDTTDPLATLEEIVNDAIALERCVLVPSFAIGRTQEMLWFLRELFDSGRTQRVPIYVDSPMASAVSLLYFQNQDELDPDIKVDLREGRSPFASDFVKFTKDRNMSKALNDMRGPMIVISGSGMANGGRILHHMRRRLSDPSTLVLFTGYQAEGTLGRRLLEGAPEVHIYGDPVEVRAEVRRLDSLSAHADQGETMRWLGSFIKPPKTTYLVHGEPPAQAVLKAKIEAELGWKVEVPAQGQSFDLL